MPAAHSKLFFVVINAGNAGINNDMAPGTPPPAAAGAFCGGFNSMNHGGFIVGPSTLTCEGIFVNGWALYNNPTYGFSVFGTFATAVIVQMLSWARREHLGPRREALGFVKHRLAAFFINLFQVAMLYALMLLAMLNDLWFFLAIVLGLTVGHTLFNFGKA